MGSPCGPYILVPGSPKAGTGGTAVADAVLTADVINSLTDSLSFLVTLVCFVLGVLLVYFLHE